MVFRCCKRNVSGFVKRTFWIVIWMQVSSSTSTPILPNTSISQYTRKMYAFDVVFQLALVCLVVISYRDDRTRALIHRKLDLAFGNEVELSSSSDQSEVGFSNEKWKFKDFQASEWTQNQRILLRDSRTIQSYFRSV